MSYPNIIFKQKITNHAVTCYELAKIAFSLIFNFFYVYFLFRERSGSVVECLTGDRRVMGLFVCFVALRPKSTAMVIGGRSVRLTTLFPGQA